jgi:beta-fructofuranosidase
VQVQSLATSQDGLISWKKYANNPIISEVPAEAKQTEDFRDPFVWHEDDSWYMAVGSRIKDVGGAVFLYRSQNLTNWDYIGPLLISDDHKPSNIWECPNFFKLDDKWVLLISSHTGTVSDTVFYFVGDYEDHRFIPRYGSVFDHGVCTLL